FNPRTSARKPTWPARGLLHGDVTASGSRCVCAVPHWLYGRGRSNQRETALGAAGPVVGSPRRELMGDRHHSAAALDRQLDERANRTPRAPDSLGGPSDSAVEDAFPVAGARRQGMGSAAGHRLGRLGAGYHLLYRSHQDRQSYYGDPAPENAADLRRAAGLAPARRTAGEALLDLPAACIVRRVR